MLQKCSTNKSGTGREKIYTKWSISPAVGLELSGDRFEEVGSSDTNVFGVVVDISGISTGNTMLVFHTSYPKIEIIN